MHTEMKTSLHAKIKRLENILKDISSAILAYSGGVDSSFLLFMMKKVMKKVIAVTAVSPTFPDKDFKKAKKLTNLFGVEHIIVNSCEMENENFIKNPPERCYYCKKELFSILRNIANKKAIPWICDGSNYDDLQDYRPGRLAGKETGVRSPLIESEFTKSDIKKASKIFSIPYYKDPPSPCLASRFPYGEEITIEKLKMVQSAENFLMKKGFRIFRVRYVDKTAKIEVAEKEMERLLSLKKEISLFFKKLGFVYITLDLDGYRTGSMNEILNQR